MPTTFANTINGNEILAKRAERDYAGNDLQTTYATKTEVTTGLSGKQDTISDLATIRSGAQAGATAVQPGDLATVAVTGAYSDLTGTPTIPTATSDLTNDSGFITLSDVPSQVQADWTESDTSDPSYIQNKPSIPSATSDLTNDSGFITLSDVPAQVNADWNSLSGASEILNKPTIPSGTQLVPAATSADEDKVLTVDSQGVPAWASAQAPISAGDGIDITNNVVSAKVDGTTIDTNASGELTVIGGGGGGTQADWTEDDPTDPSYIENKPTPKTLVAGTNITITESSSTLTVAATWQNAQADWTETDPNEPAYIQHKPTIPSGNQLVPAATSADEGKCLVVDSNGDPEWGTGGKTYTGTDGVVVDNVNDTVGLEAPVDLVGGPGITVDNPDGNTVRVSANMDSTYLNQLAVALGVDETVLWEGTITVSGNSNLNTVIQLSESVLNFERIEVFCDGNINYLTWHPVSGITSPVAYQGLNENTSNDVVIGGAIIQESDYTKIRYRCGYGSSFTTAYRGEYWGYGKPYKVVGIHRIAGGN